MSRIRTVKPELFKHEELFEAEHKEQLPLRLAFIALLTCCDREGRFRWQPRRLKLDMLPYDEIDLTRVLDALAYHGFIKKYEHEGKYYGYIPSWKVHQQINNKETGSQLPSPQRATIIEIQTITPNAASNSMRSDMANKERVDVLSTTIEPSALAESQTTLHISLHSATPNLVSPEKATQIISMSQSDSVTAPEAINPGATLNAIVSKFVDKQSEAEILIAPLQKSTLLEEEPITPAPIPNTVGSVVPEQETLSIVFSHVAPPLYVPQSIIHTQESTTIKSNSLIPSSIAPSFNLNNELGTRASRVIDASLTHESRVNHALNTKDLHVNHACREDLSGKEREGNGKGKEGERNGTIIASCTRLSSSTESIVQIFEHWKAVMNHPNARLDDARKVIIRKALSAGYSVEQLCYAITGCSVTPYNTGDNERGQRYDGLHVILRDGDQIDRFIRHYQKPPRRKNDAERRTDSNIEVLQRWVNSKMQEVASHANA